MVSAPVSSSEVSASNGSAATSPRIATWGARKSRGAAGRASAARPSIGLVKHAAAPAPSATSATAAAIHGARDVGAVPPRPPPIELHATLVIVPGPSRSEVVGIALVGAAGGIGGVQHDADDVALHEAKAFQGLAGDVASGTMAAHHQDDPVHPWSQDGRVGDRNHRRGSDHDAGGGLWG